jgi:hypothetical protein
LIFFRFSSWVAAVWTERRASAWEGSYARIDLQKAIAVSMFPLRYSTSPFSIRDPETLSTLAWSSAFVNGGGFPFSAGWERKRTAADQRLPASSRRPCRNASSPVFFKPESASGKSLATPG